MLRARIERERPGEAVLGEEEGGGDATAVDPRPDRRDEELRPRDPGLRDADRARGTASRSCSAPALGRRWWATRGGGAFANGERLASPGGADRGRRCSRSRARTGWTSASSRSRERELGAARLRRLLAVHAARRGRRRRLRRDVANHWDLAAPKLIVEEAGGRLTDLTGADRADGGSALASNGLLHDEVLAALGRVTVSYLALGCAPTRSTKSTSVAQ